MTQHGSANAVAILLICLAMETLPLSLSPSLKSFLRGSWPAQAATAAALSPCCRSPQQLPTPLSLFPYPTLLRALVYISLLLSFSQKISRCNNQCTANLFWCLLLLGWLEGREEWNSGRRIRYQLLLLKLRTIACRAAMRKPGLLPISKWTLCKVSIGSFFFWVVYYWLN